ncbi:hypothetical protein K0M31_017992 [Melipona bicolor]|uniref:Uncharacterized protein n=1 Tax=Melipona bicolor TaxID=60889 RepID=A0AA40KDX6_9HYME|nr:hypothetical protein K0M31_017992 [Melipona bicolor]
MDLTDEPVDNAKPRSYSSRVPFEWLRSKYEDDDKEERSAGEWRKLNEELAIARWIGRFRGSRFSRTARRGNDFARRCPVND